MLKKFVIGFKSEQLHSPTEHVKDFLLAAVCLTHGLEDGAGGEPCRLGGCRENG